MEDAVNGLRFWIRLILLRLQSMEWYDVDSTLFTEECQVMRNELDKSPERVTIYCHNFAAATTITTTTM